MNKVEFVTDLDLRVLRDDSFRLKADFIVVLDGEVVIIPEGFDTDLASVPRVPIAYLMVGGRGHKAAVLHDWLYRTGQKTRGEADAWFYYALRASGVGVFYSRMMYAGVRVGGARPFEIYKMEREEAQQAIAVTENQLPTEQIVEIEERYLENVARS